MPSRRHFALRPHAALLRGLLCVTLLWAMPGPAWAAPDGVPPGTCDCKPNVCCTCRQPKEPPCPPAWADRRFTEDWRPCLCIPCCERVKDWSDCLKAVRLTRRAGAWVDSGGQIRMRVESWRNFGFGGPAANDDSWMLVRARAHADIHLGERMRVYVEGLYADQIDHRRLPGGPRPIDIDRGDLLNFFGELSTGSRQGLDAGVRLGRQELLLGKQRLVSPLDWANTRRTFDGVSAWAAREFHRLEGFAVRPVTVKAGTWDAGDSNRTFWGLDYENSTLDCLTWGAYGYGLHDERAASRQDRYTFGARADGKVPRTRLDYDVEGAWQFGHVVGGSISAAMASATIGWRPCTRCFEPRLAAGLDYASGDGTPGTATPDTGTFHQLFPLGHAFLGHMDLIGRQNVVATRLEGSMKAARDVTVRLWLHHFHRADSADAVYDAAGGVLRAPGGSTAGHVGSEIDFMIQYKLDRHWEVGIEYGHFFPDAFLQATGAAQDMDWWWLGVQGTF